MNKLLLLIPIIFTLLLIPTAIHQDASATHQGGPPPNSADEVTFEVNQIGKSLKIDWVYDNANIPYGNTMEKFNVILDPQGHWRDIIYINADPNWRSYTVDNLTVGTEYIIKVHPVSVNDKGNYYSGWSTPQNVRVLTPAHILDSVIWDSDKNVIVDWSYFEPITDSELVNMIFWSEIGNPSNTDNLLLTGEHTTATIPDIDTTKNWNFKLSYSAPSVGESDWSNSITLAKLPTPDPVMPKTFTLENTKNSVKINISEAKFLSLHTDRPEYYTFKVYHSNTEKIDANLVDYSFAVSTTLPTIWDFNNNKYHTESYPSYNTRDVFQPLYMQWLNLQCGTNYTIDAGQYLQGSWTPAIVDTFTFTACGAAEPTAQPTTQLEVMKKKKHSSTNDQPPWLGIDKDGKVKVDAGVIINGSPIDAANFHTTTIIPNTTLGALNHIQLTYHDVKGPSNIKLTQLCSVDEIGTPLGAAQWCIEVYINYFGNDITNPTIQEIKVIDLDNNITFDTAALELRECTANSSAKACLTTHITYSYNTVPNSPVLASSAVNYQQATWHNYFNDGLNVIDPNPTAPVVVTPYKYECKDPALDTINVPTRMNCNFKDLIASEAQRALESLNQLE